MKLNNKIVTFILGVSLCVHLADVLPAQEQSDQKKNLAFLVGVSAYKDSSIEDLAYAHNDVQQLGEELQQMSFNVTMLTQAEATRENISKRFEAFIQKASEVESDAIVLIMFSGHGQQLRVSGVDEEANRKVTEVPFFCPVDAVAFNSQKHNLKRKTDQQVADDLNLFSLNDVIRELDETSNSLNNLLIVDACRSNPAKGKAAGISGTGAEIPRGVSILFAARSGQKSWESADPSSKHGVLTHFMLKGLRGRAKNSRGHVTWSRLVGYVRDEVEHEGWKLAGDVSRKQNPQSIINNDRVIIFERMALPSQWTRYRGPNGSATWPTCGFPLKWSETENVKWKAKLPGAGNSSPIVVGNRIFLTAWSGVDVKNQKRARGRKNLDQKPDKSRENLKRILICIDLQTGQKLWQSELQCKGNKERMTHNENGFASSTPTTDGNHVFVNHGNGIVSAWDFTGAEVWRVDLGLSNEEDLAAFGSGASPILYQDLLILNMAAENQQIFALDKNDGSSIWSTYNESLQKCFTTPIVWDSGTEAQLVIGMPNRIVGFNVRTGQELWGLGDESGRSYNFASPMVVGGKAFHQMDRALYAITLDSPNDASSKMFDWKTSGTGLSVFTVFGKHVVGLKANISYHIESETGEIIEKDRLPKSGNSVFGGLKLSTPVVAGNTVIAQTQNGTAHVYDLSNGREYSHANTIVEEDPNFLATPAITDNELLIRSNRYLYCISHNSN